jgi:hypothetical protein
VRRGHKLGPVNDCVNKKSSVYRIFGYHFPLIMRNSSFD